MATYMTLQGANVAHEARQTQQPQQTEHLGEAQYPQRSTSGVQELKVVLVEDQKDVVERYGADQVEEEPRANVSTGDQLRIEYDLLGQIRIHDT